MDGQGVFKFRLAGAPITGQRKWSTLPREDLKAIARALASNDRP